MPDILNKEQITEKLAELSGWEVNDEGMLTRTFTMPSYMAGLAFASAVGTVAEGINHHPDLMIGYKKVTVSFVTHDEGNVLTANDFAAAVAVNTLPYPQE